jgi:cobalt-zinc-cadmium efflux system outer membrane protein
LAATPPLDLSTQPTDEALATLLWERAPELQDARARVAAALAETRKTRRLPNPELDVGLNTLPLGALNPDCVADSACASAPWLNIPNLQVGLSVLLEIGKREPRQEAAAWAVRAAALEALEALRQRVLTLHDVLGDVAAAQVRVATLAGLTEDARRLAELQAARASKGDTSDLDADRARLEQEGSTTALGEAEEQLSAALRACAELVAAPCLPFDGASQAADWLERRIPYGGDDVTERPDLKALDAAARAARAAQLLASRQWLPDPTVRLGYVHDRYLASGNQQNSLFVGFSTPLRLFERGQDDAQAQAVAAEAAQRSREQLAAAARAQLERVRSEIDRIEARQARLKREALPLARSVVERLQLAVTRGAAPVQELLLARRTLAELTLTAAALDRAVHALHVARARLSASPFPVPEALDVRP